MAARPALIWEPSREELVERVPKSMFKTVIEPTMLRNDTRVEFFEVSDDAEWFVEVTKRLVDALVGAAAARPTRRGAGEHLADEKRVVAVLPTAHLCQELVLNCSRLLRSSDVALVTSRSICLNHSGDGAEVSLTCYVPSMERCIVGLDALLVLYGVEPAARLRRGGGGGGGSPG